MFVAYNHKADCLCKPAADPGQRDTSQVTETNRVHVKSLRKVTEMFNFESFAVDSLRGNKMLFCEEIASDLVCRIKGKIRASL